MSSSYFRLCGAPGLGSYRLDDGRGTCQFQSERMLLSKIETVFGTAFTKNAGHSTTLACMPILGFRPRPQMSRY